MASVEAAIYSGLTGHAGLSALVSTRVYPMRKPQAIAYPAITFGRVTTTREHTITNVAQVAEGRFQFDVWAETYDETVAITEELLEAIRALASVSGITVYERTVEDEGDMFEPEVELFRRSIEATILYGGVV